MRFTLLDPGRIVAAVGDTLIENDWCFHVLQTVVIVTVFVVAYCFGMGIGTILDDFFGRLAVLMMATF